MAKTTLTDLLKKKLSGNTEPDEADNYLKANNIDPNDPKNQEVGLPQEMPNGVLSLPANARDSFQQDSSNPNYPMKKNELSFSNAEPNIPLPPDRTFSNDELKNIGAVDESGKPMDNKTPLNDKPPFDLNKFLGDVVGGVSNLDPTRLLNPEHEGIIQHVLGISANNQSTNPSFIDELTNLGSGAKNAAMGMLAMTPGGAAVNPLLQGLGLGNIYDTPMNTSSDANKQTTGNSMNPTPSTGVPSDIENSQGKQAELSPEIIHQQYTQDRISALTTERAKLSQIWGKNPQIQARISQIDDAIKVLNEAQAKNIENTKNIQTARHAFGSYQPGTDEYKEASSDAQVVAKVRVLLKSLRDAEKSGNPATFEALAMQASDFEKLVSGQRVTEDQRQQFIPIVRSIHGLLTSGDIFIPKNIRSTYQSILGIYDTGLQDFKRHADIANAGSQTQNSFLGNFTDRESGNPMTNNDIEKLRNELNDPKSSIGNAKTANEMKKYMADVYAQTGAGMAAQTIGTVKGAGTEAIDTIRKVLGVPDSGNSGNSGGKSGSDKKKSKLAD